MTGVIWTSRLTATAITEGFAAQGSTADLDPWQDA